MRHGITCGEVKVYMSNSRRRSEHQKPEALEASLKEVSGLILSANEQLATSVHPSDLPIVFVLGCARSGTTLVYQSLAYSGAFCYPTNFLSRFYAAPILGAKLQHLLYSQDFLGEMLGFGDGNPSPFLSNLGKTRGPLAPHEFWYFWRRFFQFGNDQGQLLGESDLRGFSSEIRCTQTVLGGPMVMKGMILNWQLELLYSCIPNTYFLFVQRDLQANARSLLEARKEFFGDESQWYSFKPPGYEKLLSHAALDQTRWQVQATNDAVESSLSRLPESRVFRVEFDAFRGSPKQELQTVIDRLGLDCELPGDFPDTFAK